MVSLAIGAKPRLATIMSGLSLISIIMSVFTGERINFLIRACGGMLAALAWKPHWRRYIVLIIIEVVAVLAVFVINPSMHTRYVDSFIRDLPTGPHSTYYQTIVTGPKAAEEALFLGLGPATYRDLCPKILNSPEKKYCSNHPHNFYIQLLTETGISGLIAGSLMFVCIILGAFHGWRKNRNNVVAATAFVVPLAFFFPVQTTGDFFGQWNNIFMWSAIALSLAAARTLDTNKY
jgi:O-antigen ligase